MIRKNPAQDRDNPPGQIVNPLPQTLEKNIEQWRRWADGRKAIEEHERLKRKETPES